VRRRVVWKGNTIGTKVTRNQLSKIRELIKYEVSDKIRMMEPRNGVIPLFDFSIVF
jgi:hypothetical protein